jgi:hypothetical protein
MRKLILSLGALMIFIGIELSCSNPSNKEPTFSATVLSVLNTGATRQTVILFRPFESPRSNTGFLDTDPFHISRANIAINDFRLQEQDARVSRFESPRFFYELDSIVAIKPDSTYRLSIIFEGSTISGETTVPGAFQITSPSQMQTISLQQSQGLLSVNWSESKHAKRYGVEIIGPKLWIRGSSQNDSSLFEPRQKIDAGSATSTQIRLNFTIGRRVVIVTAYDKNYDRHVFQGFLTAGISNAYGVFGSATVADSVMVEIIR